MTLMGEVFLKDRMWDAAALCFGNLLEKVEPDWRLLSILGLINREMDFLDRSIEYYRKAADMPDALPEVFSDLSIALIKNGDLKEAEEMLRSLLESIEGAPQVWNNLGTVLEIKGELDQALESYERAVELDERYYPSLYSIGRILQKKGDMERAREYMDRALKIEGRVYNIEDVSGREKREADGKVHAKEVMTSDDRNA
jgi:tetratricopeptide (TPR) repeat protein